MKSTDRNLFACEQFSAERASEHLKREQDYAHKARLARKAIDECKQEESDKEEDDKAFWKVVYIFIHVAAVALVLFTLMHFGSK